MAMQSIAPAPQNQDMNADNDLRAQLAAVINTTQQQQQQQQLQLQHQHQHAHAPHSYNEVHHSSSASPHDQNIDPSIGGPGGMMSTGNESGGDDSMGDGRKGGKRELSQSKRAAQNRAAQRAFRQRKEGYIKKLEEQVRDMGSLTENYKAIQTENYSLREYIIHLQSRLIESQGDYPQPPPNVVLNHPPRRDNQSGHPQRHEGAPVAPMAPMAQLQASAARNIAVAGLQSGKHAQESQPQYEDNKRYRQNPSEDAAEEAIIRSQLQSDGLPTTMSM